MEQTVSGNEISILGENSMKTITLIIAAAALTAVLLIPCTAYAAEPGTEETVSGNNPGLPSIDEPTGEPMQESIPAALEGLLGQASGFSARLEEIKESLENISVLLGGMAEAMEKQEESWTAYYEGMQETLLSISQYLEEDLQQDGNGIMLLSDSDDYLYHYLSDYYNTELGYVVLPSRSAYQYYWSSSYNYQSKSGQSWKGQAYIEYKDKPYLLSTYGYDLDTDSGNWSMASDGCFVETKNLYAYLAFLSPEPEPDPDPDPEEPETDLIPYLEAVIEKLETLESVNLESRETFTDSAKKYTIYILLFMAVMIGGIFGQILSRYIKHG